MLGLKNEACARLNLLSQNKRSTTYQQIKHESQSKNHRSSRGRYLHADGCYPAAPAPVAKRLKSVPEGNEKESGEDVDATITTDRDRDSPLRPVATIQQQPQPLARPMMSLEEDNDSDSDDPFW